MAISIITVMDRKGVIGKLGRHELLWRIPADLVRFKKITMGAALIVGNNTHRSIGRALPGRMNIVVSHRPVSTPDCLWANSIEQALLMASEFSEEVFCIGGALIYGQILPLADKLYLTRIDHEFEGDAYFPEVNWQDWQLQNEERLEPSEQVPYAVTFQVYERRK